MSAFQSQVNTVQAPAVAGDFCDHNSRFVCDAGPGGMVVGASGLTIGRFAWATTPNDADGTPATVSNAGSGAPTGFVGRHQQALITTYLADASMVIPEGFGCTLYSGGGFWVANDGSGANTFGQKAYASNTDGTVLFDATGQSHAGYTETKFIAMSVGAAGELVKISDHAQG